MVSVIKGKVKVKWSRYRPGVAQRVGRGIAVLFHDRGTRRGWVVSSTPRPQFTPGKNRYPFYRRLGGPQGRSGRAENLVRTGIRSRTVQPLVSRYTDWATGPILWHHNIMGPPSYMRSFVDRNVAMLHIPALWGTRTFTSVCSQNKLVVRHLCIFYFNGICKHNYCSVCCWNQLALTLRQLTALLYYIMSRISSPA